MSAYVLSKEEIDNMTQVTASLLQLNRKYPGSYHLHKETVDLIGKYADDLHNIYRALFIANIKAVNGRYGEGTKTLPKYTPLKNVDVKYLSMHHLKETAGIYNSYLYQCSEDPVYMSPIFNAFYDVYKLLCMYIIEKSN